MNFGPFGCFRSMRHQLLNGHPVVQDLLVALLHHLALAEFDDAELFSALAAALRALFQTIEPAALHELTPSPLFLGPQQLLLALFLAPVAAHLHLTHGVIVRGHTTTAFLFDLKCSLTQQPVPHWALSDIACAITAHLYLPLEFWLRGLCRKTELTLCIFYS